MNPQETAPETMEELQDRIRREAAEFDDMLRQVILNTQALERLLTDTRIFRDQVY